MDTTWEKLTNEVREIGLLSGAVAYLHWDQQTYMPKGSGGLRGEQIGALSKVCHQRFTAPEIGDWLSTLASSDLEPERATAVAKLQEDYDRRTKLSADLVERQARAQTAGFEAWVKAKGEDDFSVFAPHLQTLIDISKEKAAAFDSEGHPLQVLMAPHDPGVEIDDLKATFARLQSGLTELIEATRDTELASLGGHWPEAGQRGLHAEVAAALGYDFVTGRLDAAPHPFTISMGHSDVRITTSYHEDDLLAGLGATVHEAGHGMYEQGLPRRLAGTGLDQAASLGMHESQSRFWENAIGGSRAFFEWLHPMLESHFPGHGVSVDDLYRSANRIEPGFIRVEADEVTYNLHIIARVELELALFEGRLSVADLPDAWNEKYAKYLGITPSNASQGVLQDVHWSGGAFAYFQSYTLGNLYAAGFLEMMKVDLPGLDDHVRKGEFAPILSWLRERVHTHGRALDGEQRVRAIVGDRDLVSDLLNGLWGRHGALYGVSR